MTQKDYSECVIEAKRLLREYEDAMRHGAPQEARNRAHWLQVVTQELMTAAESSGEERTAWYRVSSPQQKPAPDSGQQ